jgi:hypothetical protein
MSDDAQSHQRGEVNLDNLRRWIESSQSGEIRQIIDRARKTQQELADARRVNPDSLQVPVNL